MPNQRHKLERIDIDELFSSPVNRGMLSFLERPPEEAWARLREKQKVNAIDASRMSPGGELLPGQETQEIQEVTTLSLPSGSDISLHGFGVRSIPSDPPPGGNLPIVEQLLVGSPALLRSQDIPDAELVSTLGCRESEISPFPTTTESQGKLPAEVKLTPACESPTGQLLPPRGELPSSEQCSSQLTSALQEDYPSGNLPLGVANRGLASRVPTQSISHPVGGDTNVAENSEERTQFRKSRTRRSNYHTHLLGNSPPGETLSYRIHQASLRTLSPEKGITNAVQPEAIDGSVIGRRQKVRRAIVAQDGHSSGEQLLYQALWNAGSAETPETRLLSIGYSGMSALCKLEKSNCKKNVQGLIQKLAVEITEPHQSVSSTGTTYRIFSYKEILRRREAAGMVWVVRTSGVQFVNPLGNSPSRSEGELPGGAGGELPPQPMGSPALGAGGVLPAGPVGKTPVQIEKNRNKQENLLTSASENIRQLYTFARSQIAEFDDDACRLLWRKCKEVAPDCTLAEIIYCFDLKARQLLNGRVRNVANPVGLMIWSVPKMFEGFEALYLQRRRAIAEEARKAAEAVAQFEQNRTDWQALVDDPSTSEEDRWFYRKLLGDPNS